MMTALRYVLGDHLGGTNLVTDDAGDIVETLDYYPYGGLRIDAKAGSYEGEKRKYIGQEYDAATSLSYLNARYYDSGRGQFVSQDPVFWEKQNLADPQSLNSYSYALNNPIAQKDPTGRETPTLQQLFQQLAGLLQGWLTSLGGSSGSGGGSGGGGKKSTPVPGPSGGGIFVPNVLPKSAWVSQWSLNNPGTACREACDQMGPPTGENLKTVEFIDGKPVVRADAKRSIDVINKNLLNGKPVTVGVRMDSLESVGNVINPSTNHFIKVVGANVDERGQYYTFFDPGTRNPTLGTSPQNRLYVQPDGSLVGSSQYHETVGYVVTQVP